MANILQQVEAKVKSTIQKYKLFTKKEKVFVAYSGGKDSTVILYILKKLGYSIEAITINAFIGNYSKKNLENVIKFCKDNKIKLHQISFRDEFGYSLCYLRDMIHAKGYRIKSCTICGVLRRYLINKYSRKLKAKKIVLGHNLDDEAQAILMNLLKGNLDMAARSGPAIGLVRDKLFTPRVKPLYFVSEKETTLYSKEMGFPVVYEKCPCSSDSYRRSIKELLSRLETENSSIKKNIVSCFLKTLPKLRKHFAAQGSSINACKYCSEPCRQQVCKSCQLISLIMEK